MAQLVDVPGAYQDHLSHPDAAAIYAKCLTIEGNGLDAMAAVSKDLLGGMLRTINECGTIYVNSVGGYFPISKGFEEVEIRTVATWVLPGETISVKRWPGGKHWYASIGGVSVTRNGETKWGSKAIAQLNAEKWAQENGIKVDVE